MTFSPDSKYFIVWFTSNSKPGELRHGASGQVVVPLVGTPLYVTFSPDSKYFVVQYSTGQPGQLRRGDTAQVVASLAGAVYNVTFIRDSEYFVVRYSTGQPGELWTIHDTPHRLISNINRVTLARNSQYAIALYSTGQVYFLDMTWLDTITNQAETLPEAELIKLACTELLTPTQFDEKTLQPYLGTQAPAACH